ncbi:hypothetical protein, partial [Sphingomonas endophytica]
MSSLNANAFATPGSARFSVRITGPDRFVIGGAEWLSSDSRLAMLLRVTLAAPAVRSVTVDRQRHEVEVQHEPGSWRAVAANYRIRPADLPELDVEPEEVESHRRRSFFRYGRLI